MGRKNNRRESLNWSNKDQQRLDGLERHIRCFNQSRNKRKGWYPQDGGIDILKDHAEHLERKLQNENGFNPYQKRF